MQPRSEIRKLPSESINNCTVCGKYVKTSGDNTLISMAGTPEEKRRHSEGYCPKEKD